MAETRHAAIIDNSYVTTRTYPRPKVRLETRAHYERTSIAERTKEHVESVHHEREEHGAS